MDRTGALPIDTDSSSPIIIELIYRLKVRDVMTRNLSTCAVGNTVRDAQEMMKANGITGVPIVDGTRLIGIISMDDVIRALEAGRVDSPLTDYMTRSVIVLEDDMPLSFGISYLEKYRYGRFPVLEAQKNLVGIITSRDVITALLVEINKEVQRFEDATRQQEVDGPGFRLEYTTRTFDFEMAGRLSTETKKLLKERGLPSRLIRRIAVATYELEMNQVVHSAGGTVRVLFSPDDHEVEIVAADQGPGIPDIEQALSEGFSTANEWIRSLGFGAGMGLPNTRRVADSFDITSSPEGTTVRATITVPMEDNP